MTPEAREYAERAVSGAPTLTPEQVRRLTLQLAPAVAAMLRSQHSRKGDAQPR